MEGNIRLLLEKEAEAKKQIECAEAYKEKMKTKAVADAEDAINIIRKEHNRALDELREKSAGRMAKIENELSRELETFTAEMQNKDVEELVAKLCEIISGTRDAIE